MRGTLHRPDPHFPRAAVWLGIGLIAATAVAALLVTGLAVKAAATSIPSRMCPPADRHRPAARVLRTGERHELVPPGARRLTVCRYNGMNALGGAPRWALRGAGATSDGTRIRRITAELDALMPTHGVYSCPMDDDSDDIATFGYGTAPGVVVSLDTTGCNEITNGHVHRLGLDKPVVSQLEALAKLRDSRLSRPENRDNA